MPLQHFPKDRQGRAGTVSENGNITESLREREHAIMGAHFPKGPPGNYAPKGGGRATELIVAQLVGTLLVKASNTSAPGDDRISADVIEVYWQWKNSGSHARSGLHHSKLWKSAKGVVIPKPGSLLKEYRFGGEDQYLVY